MKFYFKQRHYGQVQASMGEAIRYAPTKKSKEFFKSELKRMLKDW